MNFFPPEKCSPGWKKSFFSFELILKKYFLNKIVYNLEIFKKFQISKEILKTEISSY